MDDPTRVEAQKLLAAAELGTDRGQTLARRTMLGSILGIALGVLVGAFLLAGVYVLPVATLPVALIVSAAYVVGILAFVTVYNVGRRVVPAGWMRRFHRGLSITLVVFAIGLALSFLTPERSLLLWIPLAVAAALPVGILSSLRTAR